MAKGYMISAHRSAADPEKASAYRELAIPALLSMGENSCLRVAELLQKKMAWLSAQFSLNSRVLRPQ